MENSMTMSLSSEGKKGFDEFYKEMRANKKFIDLGEKLKSAGATDLTRVQLLVSHFPNLVQNFVEGIGENYEQKSCVRSKQSFSKSKEMANHVEAIEELNNAIRFNPSTQHCSLGSTLTNTQSQNHSQSLNEQILKWFLGLPVLEIQTEEPELLSKIYNERSKRFALIGDRESAIVDIFSAIDCVGGGKTLECVFQVAEHYRALGQDNPEAQLIFQHYLQLLSGSTVLNNEQKSVQTLKAVKHLKDIKSGGSEQILSQGTITTTTTTTSPKMTSTLNRLSDIMEFYGGTSPVLIAASEALQLKHTSELGRHAVAKKPIPPGKTVIVDKPYSWSLSRRMYLKFCQHCCRKIRTLRTWVPCQECSSVVFCSWECLRKSEHYHKFECRILQHLDSSESLGEMGLLSYRTIARTPLKTLAQFTNHPTDNQNSSPGTTIETFLGLDDHGRLDPTNYASVFAQTTNSEKRPPADILKRTLAAVFLTVCLRFTGFFSSGMDENGIEKSDELSELEMGVGGLLLRHLQSTSCNAYEINHVIGAEDKNPRHLQIIPIGGATYPTVSITNHSCFPNVYRFNIGKLSIVKTICDIGPGEQILDSYGESFTTQSRTERQSILSTQYFFKCTCPPCQGDWALYRELASGTQIQPKAAKISCCGKIYGKEAKKCSRCGKKIDLRRVIRDLRNSEENYKAQRDSLISGALITSDMESAFATHVSNLQSMTFPPSCPDKLIVECQETLKLMWNLAQSSSS